MPIENTTVYTKKRLLQLTYYVVNTNPHTWILLGITVLCFLMFSATALFNLVMSLLLKLVFKIEMPMDFAPHELGITLLIFLSICVVTVFFYFLPFAADNRK